MQIQIIKIGQMKNEIQHFALSYVMTMAVPNATEAKYLSSTIMPLPRTAHHASSFLFIITTVYIPLPSHTSRARIYATSYVCSCISTKLRANNIKMWFAFSGFVIHFFFFRFYLWIDKNHNVREQRAREKGKEDVLMMNLRLERRQSRKTFMYIYIYRYTIQRRQQQ